MAFVRLESWGLETGGSPGPAPLWARAPSVRRGAAGAFTLLVHSALLWLFLTRLADGLATEPDAAPEPVRAFTLTAGVPAEQAPAAAARVQAVLAAAAPTPLDLSAPADLPVPEWSRSPMSVPRSAASAAPGAGSDMAGAGRGGGGLGQFIGFGDGIGGELLIDGPMLEAVRRAALAAYPQARGRMLVFLRVGPTGIVLDAVVKGGNRATAAALRGELLGKRLFAVRSRIQGSALVALPPIDMGRYPGRPPAGTPSAVASLDETAPGSDLPTVQ